MSEVNEFQQLVGDLIENWQPVKVPPYVTLQGQYCSVHPMDAAKHLVPLFANLSLDNKGESWTYLPYGPFTTNTEFRNWVDTTRKLELDTQLYTIMDQKLQPVGVVGYMRINPTHATIEIGHVHFSKLLKKTPAATEAIFLMLQHAFDDLHYRRVEWKCHSYNEPSRKAALRFGFQFEGIFRQCNVIRGRNRDTAWYSMLDKEWPEIKQKFQKWLSADNFDANGMQINKL